MSAIHELAPQVKANCQISNAHHWGVYSICGLLIRLIDYYKWENTLTLSARFDQSALMEWIHDQETAWEDLVEEEFKDLTIGGRTYSPFDVDGIDALIGDEGYIYGAGYVAGMKPSFFLAEKVETKKENGFTIHVLGRELARDLTGNPAMLQGNRIYARSDVMARNLWGKIEEYRQSKKDVLGYAFECYGISREELEGQLPPLEEKIPKIAESELATYIHHEMGEALDTVFPEKLWEDIMTSEHHSSLEFAARGIQDLLADTSDAGMLRYIIDSKKEGSLAFYVAFQTGYRKMVFPEIVPAYWSFKDSGDWSIVEEARKVGFDHAVEYTRSLEEIYEAGTGKDPGWIEKQVQERILGFVNSQED